MKASYQIPDGGWRARLATQPPGYRLPLGRVFAMYSGLMLVTVISALDQTIVATATPSIVGDIGGLSEYSWVFTAYMLASAVTIPLYGRLGDSYGRRRILLISIAVFTAGSALCGFAPSMPFLIAARVVQGIGAGGLIPMSTATISSVVPLRERGKFDGFIGIGYSAGSIAGPLVGGLLVDHTTWRWIFFVSVPVAVLALVVIAATVPSLGERTEHALDWRGALLLGTATASLLLGLVWGGRRYGWLDVHVVSALAVALVAALVFVAIERRTPEPIVPLALLRNGPIAASLVCVSLGALVMFGLIAYLPLFVQGGMGISATESGLALIPMMLGHAGMSMVSGQWISRTGKLRPNAIIGPLLLAAATALLCFLTAGSTVGEAARDMFIAGLGIGTMNQVFLLSVQNSVPRRMLGTASALVQFGRVLGGSIGIAILGTVINHGLPSGHRFNDAAGNIGITAGALARAIQPVFIVMTGCALAVFVVALRWIREMPLSRSVDEEHPAAGSSLEESVDFRRPNGTPADT